jgi:hypothetical protein
MNSRPSAFSRVEVPWLVATGVRNTIFHAGTLSGAHPESVSVVVPFVQSSPLFVSDYLDRIT